MPVPNIDYDRIVNDYFGESAGPSDLAADLDSRMFDTGPSFQEEDDYFANHKVDDRHAGNFGEATELRRSDQSLYRRGKRKLRHLLDPLLGPSDEGVYDYAPGTEREGFFEHPIRNVGQALGIEGRIAQAAGEDVANYFGGDFSNENLSAVSRGEKVLPAEQKRAERMNEKFKRGEFPLREVAGNVASGFLKSAPKIAHMALFPQGLLSQAAAGAGLFGLDDNGNFHAKDAIVGAIMPVAGAVGRLGAARLNAAAMRAGASVLDNPTVQKVVETVGDQAAVAAVMAGSELPELKKMKDEGDPRYWSSLAEIAGTAVAFGMLGGKHVLGKEIPSATQQYFEQKGHDLIDNFRTNPRYQARITREATQALTQRNKPAEFRGPDYLNNDAVTVSPQSENSIPARGEVGDYFAPDVEQEPVKQPSPTNAVDVSSKSVDEPVPEVPVEQKVEKPVESKEDLQAQLAAELGQEEEPTTAPTRNIAVSDLQVGHKINLKDGVQTVASISPDKRKKGWTRVQFESGSELVFKPKKNQKVEILDEGEPNASTIRSSEEQLPKEGAVDEGVKETGGNVLEQTPPEQPEPVVAGETDKGATVANEVTPKKAAQEFRKLVLDYGVPEGWIQNPDLAYNSMIEGSSEKLGTAGIKAKILRSKEISSAVRRAVSALGGEANNSTPDVLAKLLPKLKAYVEEKHVLPAKQDEAFTEATAKGKKQVTTSEMTVGDVLNIDGEQVRVTDVDADGNVTLEDGKKFGKHTLPDGQVIHVEDWIKNANGDVDFFGDEPAQELPKLRPGEKGTGDLLQGSDAPFNLAGESGKDFAKIEREKAEVAQRAAEAKALQDKQQTGLFEPNAPIKVAAGSPAFEEMVQEARRWKGASFKADRMYGKNTKARLKHSDMTTKADLDAYLKRRFGVDDVTAREVSNTLTSRNLSPDESAEVEQFRGEPWADAVLKEASPVKTQAEPNKAESFLNQLHTESGLGGEQQTKKGAVKYGAWWQDVPAIDRSTGASIRTWAGKVLDSIGLSSPTQKKSETPIALLVRDKETGKVHALGLWNNPTPYLINPKTGKGGDVAKVLAGDRYEPLAVARFKEAKSFRNDVMDADTFAALDASAKAVLDNQRESEEQRINAQTAKGFEGGETPSVVPTVEPVVQSSTSAAGLNDDHISALWGVVEDNPDATLDEFAGVLAKAKTEDLNLVFEAVKLIAEHIKEQQGLKNPQQAVDYALATIHDATTENADRGEGAFKESILRRLSEQDLPEDRADAETQEPTGERPAAANLGNGLPEGMGLSRDAAAEALAEEDTHGVTIHIVSKDEAEAITGYKEVRGYGGFEWKGEAYLVHDNIGAPKLVGPIVREEVAHALMRTAEGNRLVQEAIARGRVALNEAAKNVLRQQGYREEQLMDEFLAKSAREKRSWFREVVDSVKAFLSKFGLVNLSDEEAARVLINQIKRAVRGGEEPLFAGKEISPAPAEPKSSVDALLSSDEIPEEKERWVETQVLGQKWYVRDREHLTPQTTATAIDVAERVLSEAGFKPEKRTFQDPLDEQNKSIVFMPKTDGAERFGLKLIDLLEREISTQREEGKAADHIAALVNSIRENFDMPDSAMSQMSETVRNKLFAMAQEEASIRGRALRALANFKADVVRVSRNVDVYLQHIYSSAFGGKQISSAIQKIIAGINSRISDADLNKIASLIEDPAKAELLARAMRGALTGRFFSVGDILDTVIGSLVEGGITESDARQIASKISDKLNNVVVDAARRSAESIKAGTPSSEPIAKPKIWKTVEQSIGSGVFSDAEVMRKIAKKHGWRTPSESDVTEFKKLADESEHLRKLTPKEIEAAGGDPIKLQQIQEKVDAATENRRLKIQKDLAVKWSQFAAPANLNPFSKNYWLKENRANNAKFLNELITANILARGSFVTKQAIDVLTQWAWRMPFRAMAQAFDLNSTAIRGGNPSAFWKEFGSALNNMYSDNFWLAISPAIRNTRAVLAGRIETRNVDRMLTGMNSLERTWKKGDALFKEGKYSQGALLKFIASVGISYRVAGAFDYLHGTPAEWNERRFRVIRELRRNGRSITEANVQADWVMDGARAEYPEAMALARSILDARGEQYSKEQLAENAWNIVVSTQYHRMSELGLPVDEIRADAEFYRNTLGWNKPELRGIGAAVAMPVKVAGVIGEQVGLPLAIGRFSNAIAISINRSLHKTPLYAMADLPLPFLRGSESASPWSRTQTDIYERRIEASVGTLLGATALGLAFSGLVKVWMKPPPDKEERELWEKEGHKAGTVEFNLGDGDVAVMSLTAGPMALLAPWFATGAALNDLASSREKQQKRLEEKAARAGLAPGKLPSPNLSDWLGVAAQSFQGALLGSRTASGLLYTVTDYGTPNIKKFVASQFTPTIPYLPALQEVSRMSGVTVDPKTADFLDFMLPVPTSPGRRLNFLGDPVGTDSDAQRVIQILSGGSYPLVHTKENKEAQAYKALFETGYRPPSIDPMRGYAIGNDYRPMNESELEKYTFNRGKYFKEALIGLGDTYDKDAVKDAFDSANLKALSELGVISFSGGGSGFDVGSLSYTPKVSSGTSSRRSFLVSGATSTTRKRRSLFSHRKVEKRKGKRRKSLARRSENSYSSALLA